MQDSVMYSWLQNCQQLLSNFVMSANTDIYAVYDFPNNRVLVMNVVTGENKAINFDSI